MCNISTVGSSNAVIQEKCSLPYDHLLTYGVIGMLLWQLNWHCLNMVVAQNLFCGGKVCFMKFDRNGIFY
jgi:hypothetical protein